jgi:hypothetical protein
MASEDTSMPSTSVATFGRPRVGDKPRITIRVFRTGANTEIEGHTRIAGDHVLDAADTGPLDLLGRDRTDARRAVRLVDFLRACAR